MTPHRRSTTALLLLTLFLASLSPIAWASRHQGLTTHGVAAPLPIQGQLLYAGAMYVASSNSNISPEAALGLSLVTIYEAALQGAIWGMAFGGAAGTVAGISVGL